MHKTLFISRCDRLVYSSICSCRSVNVRSCSVPQSSVQTRNSDMDFFFRLPLSFVYETSYSSRRGATRSANRDMLVEIQLTPCTYSQSSAAVCGTGASRIPDRFCGLKVTPSLSIKRPHHGTVVRKKLYFGRDMTNLLFRQISKKRRKSPNSSTSSFAYSMKLSIQALKFAFNSSKQSSTCSWKFAAELHPP